MNPKLYIYYGDTKVAETSLKDMYKMKWVDENYRIIHITGGDAVKDSEFIQGLFDHAYITG